MQTDFGSEDFELNTAKQTKMVIRNYQDWMILELMENSASMGSKG